MIKLLVDTAKDTNLILKNLDETIIDEFRDELVFSQSEKLLQCLSELLAKNNLTKKDIKEITVNTGPGSYTGVRVGLTTANFLGFSLNIPVLPLPSSSLEKQFHSPLMAKYNKKPFITKEKSRLT